MDPRLLILVTWISEYLDSLGQLQGVACPLSSYKSQASYIVSFPDATPTKIGSGSGDTRAISRFC